ncbi:hypothetical protein HJC23_006700 [Cyclotella cryptica]|uniref:Uncharacterized protein n=1 Tax=Cyclotella cryptica TaxID=29204 RepID=A0ABD3QXH9_9STRA|eukprot:CCRYP_001122-RA/>CCRYP_001122-RA protein AED:0.24 eAED:0.24 QI:0/-1/0/1/-1/1/1/0/440
MSNERVTEIDQLLPTPTNPRPHFHRRLYSEQNRRRQIVSGAAFFSLFTAIYLCMIRPSAHRYHKTRERSYKPSDQLRELNSLTQSSLREILIDEHANQANNGSTIGPKQSISDTMLSTHGAQSTSSNGNTYQCLSQVMIMRHCDKDVKTRDKSGRIRIRDKRDVFGDGHCSPKGKERSAFIATLFVENEEFVSLLNGTKATVDDLSDKGVPPIPAVNASVAHADANVIKPQFPSPLKLYALNEARYNKNPMKEHKNFREVETLTPLADKFDLDIDESFGVNEEGDLAIDFFTSLSESVKMNIDRVVHRNDSMAQERELSRDDVSKMRLCQNGMTVINWKHSLIPNLARALGCGKEVGCPTKYHSHDFDTVWVITYEYSLALVIVAPPNSTIFPVENLSESSSKSSNHKHRALNHLKSTDSDTTTWKVSAQTVKEGFDQVY